MGKVSKVLKSASKSTRTLRSASKATAGTSSNVKGVLKRSRRTSKPAVKPGTGGRPKPPPKPVKTIYIDKKKYPESAKHIEEAAKKGKPTTLTINRPGAKNNRKDSLRGYPTRRGKDRDEWPPAMSKEGGKGASVKYINPSDNRGSGSIMGQGIKGLPDGAIVKIVTR